jgi:biofilm PGA synthesis N-glycosyltransferase PgaC
VLAASSSSLFYKLVLAAQIIFYAIAALAWLLERVGLHNPVLALPQYFVLTNLASVLAFYKFLRGERYARWEPIRETVSAPSAMPTLGGREQ